MGVLPVVSNVVSAGHDISISFQSTFIRVGVVTMRGVLQEIMVRTVE
jgi:hypothetical protein